jgi:hypothetical protein
VLSVFPSLQTLHLCENAFSDLSFIPRTCTSSLTLLDMAVNRLSDWKEICKLGVLCNLESLVLNQNMVGDVCSAADAALLAAAFPSLRAISLNNNNIGDWRTIDALAALPRLDDLRLRANPLVADRRALHARQLVIARMPRLAMINGSAVTPKERQIAGRFYLQAYAEEWAQSGSTDDFCARHPRFAALIDEHGPPVCVAAVSNTLQDQLFKLRVTSASDTATSLEIDVPGSMKVQQLRRLLCRPKHLGRAAAAATLSLIDQKTGTAVPLDDDSRELDFYSPVAGDTIHVT